MHPVFFEIGGFTVYTYGLMLSLALLVATMGLMREAPREGINPDHLLEAIIATAVAGLIGSRVLYVVLNWHAFSDRWVTVFFTRSGGLSFYGAFFGGVLALLLWSRWRKVGFLKLADLMAPYLALGYAIGRIGCFLNGCCYGTVSTVPWALPASAADPLLRHPVQLYASLGGVLIFIALKLLRPARPFIGFSIMALFAFYGILRFVTEFFRDEPAAWLGLSLAQLFSGALFILSTALVLLVFFSGRRNRGRLSSHD